MNLIPVPSANDLPVGVISLVALTNPDDPSEIAIRTVMHDGPNDFTWLEDDFDWSGFDPDDYHTAWCQYYIIDNA